MTKEKKIIYITELGSKTLTNAWPLMKKLEEEVSRDVTAEELEKLLSVLNKIQTNVLSLDTTLE